MSINNIYCNPKIYKELYKKSKGEALHSNPDNLKFYLFGNKVSDLDFKIIKKTKIDTSFGIVEIAIIGSSHYLKLDNYFTEILTCSEKSIHNSNIFITKQKFDSFDLDKQINDIIYKISVQSINYTDKAKFTEFEMSLYNGNYFMYAFDKKSAITALKYEKSKENFRLKTWHTYPEYNKVIYSNTEIYYQQNKHYQL